jgi:hypothetical protein
LPISKTEYEATIDFSEASSHNWEELLKDQAAFDALPKKKKKK